jgi:2-dehydropantoate 2-reductase
LADVCVYGVGAIGGLIAGRLSLAGANVTGIARGAQLHAINRDGLTLLADGERRTTRFECTENPASAGVQDVVVLALKSHALPAVAESIRPMLGPDTIVVTAANGIPWWYFHGSSVGGDSPNLERVDPGGHLWRNIGPERALGCVVYPAARIVEPGVVEHVFGDRFSIGEPVVDPTHKSSDRIRKIVALLGDAGFDVPVATDIRAEIWIKLAANAAYNPVNMLVGGVMGDMLDDTTVNALLQALMREVMAVAELVGVNVPVTPSELIDMSRVVAGHRTSMLQDLAAGRSVELDTILFAVVELARRFEFPTPTLNMIGALAAQRARLAGCYNAGPMNAT